MMSVMAQLPLRPRQEICRSMNRWSGSGSNSCTNSFASDIASKLLAFMIGPGSGIAHFLNDCTPTLAVGNIFWLTLQFASHRVISKVIADCYPNLRIAFLEAGCSWGPAL